MTIVSCSNGTGHTFLVYKSYVKDTLDFSEFTGGYQYKTWEKKAPCKYKIKCSQYVSLGNAWGALSGEKELYETKDELNDGDNAGVYFNREFAKEHAKGKAVYDKNWAYTREISQSQLKKIIKTYEEKNYYNLFSNNCTQVAVTSWNKAYPKDRFVKYTSPKKLKEDIHQRLGSFQYSMEKEVPNIR